MAFWVYMLRCSDGSYYVGHTDDLDVRMAQHHAGEIEGYTAARRPVELVFAEERSSRDEAFQRERQIKNWSRVKKEALIARDWERLHQIVHAEWRSEGQPAPPAPPSTALGMSGTVRLPGSIEPAQSAPPAPPSTALGMSGTVRLPGSIEPGRALDENE